MTSALRVGAVILCRHGSRRLPGKILLDVGGSSVLEHVVRRIRRSFADDRIVIATTTCAQDDAVAVAGAALDVPVFRGPESDVALRFLCAAVDRRFDVAMRVNGDNLFGCRRVVDTAIELSQQGAWDLVTNVPGRTFPHGMSVEAIGVEFYRAQLSSMVSDEHREHVTKYLYDHPDLGRQRVLVNEDQTDMSGLRLAIDAPEDLEMARAMWPAFDVDPADADLAAVARAWRRISA